MKLVGGLKASLIDYLYVFCLVIYGGNATMFTRGYGNILEVGAYLPIVFALIIGVKHKIKLDNNILICLGVFLLYYLAASLVNSYASLGFLSYWVITLIITYITCKSYGFKYLELFETVVFHLTVIGLVIWALYLVAPGQVMSFCKSIQFSESFASNTDVVNIIVYTLLDNDYSGDEIHLFYRNAGFAFEAGAYACFLCFAIACNIIRKGGLKLKKNIPLLIFIGALFTTESTTGGITLILVLLLWFLDNIKTSKSTVWYLVLLVPLILWIYGQGFVGEKLSTELSDSQQVSYTAGNEGGTKRIMSFLLYLEEFKSKPIFGLAGDPNSMLEAMGYSYSLHSGIGKLLAGYGIIISVLFVALCVQSKKVLDRIAGKNAIVLYGALIGSMVSYSMWEYPVLFVFVIIGFYLSSNSKRILQVSK